MGSKVSGTISKEVTAAAVASKWAAENVKPSTHTSNCQGDQQEQILPRQSRGLGCRCFHPSMREGKNDSFVKKQQWEWL